MKKAIIIASLCSASLAFTAVETKTYGFVKASYMMADKINFGDEGKPFTANDGENTNDLEDEAKSLFTSANSRWGITASNGSKTSGHFEFDLDGSAGKAAGAQSLSTGRIRHANLVYKMSKNDSLTFGKKWTIFAGVNPFTYQVTKISFFAGNTGFLVDGVEYSKSIKDTSFSLELAQNATTDVALVSAPTITLLIGQKLGNHNIGLAHTTANIQHKASTALGTLKDSTATGTKVFYSGKFGAFSAIFQYTMGSNLGSIQTGGLAKAAAANDEEYKETAILASGKYAGKGWSIFGAYGISELADEEETTDATAATPANRLTGVSKNTLMSLGFDKTLDKGLTVFVEHLAFTTGYYNGTETNDSTGSATELGMRFKF